MESLPAGKVSGADSAMSGHLRWSNVCLQPEKQGEKVAEHDIGMRGEGIRIILCYKYEELKSPRGWEEGR